MKYKKTWIFGMKKTIMFLFFLSLILALHKTQTAWWTAIKKAPTKIKKRLISHFRTSRNQKRGSISNLARKGTKKSKLKTIAIATGTAAGSYGLYEILKEKIYGPREFPTKETLAQRTREAKNKNISLRMLVFSDYGWAKQVINKIWTRKSNVSKEHAEKVLRRIALEPEHGITVWNVRPAAQVLINLAEAEELKKIKNFPGDIALKNNEELNGITSPGWSPSIVDSNLQGPFETAMNMSMFFVRHRDEIKRDAQSLVSLLKIPKEKQEMVIREILSLAEQYGNGYYELISCTQSPRATDSLSYEISSNGNKKLTQETQQELVSGRVFDVNKMYQNFYFENTDPESIKNWLQIYKGPLDPKKYNDVRIKINIPERQRTVGQTTIEDLYNTKSELYPQFKEKLQKIIEEAMYLQKK